MITVQELFARLSYGPLSNLSISSEGGGGIVSHRQRYIIHLANEALLRLHGKFVLIEREVIVRMTNGVTSYRLSGEHATSQSDENDAITYILDSDAVPFQDDVIKIMQVYNGCGCLLTLNDINCCDSLFTPQPNVLQIPHPVPDETVHIIYQARHPKLLTDPVDLTAQIDLPEVLEEAFVSLIAYKVFNAMNGQEHKLKAADHLSNYEIVCQNVIEKDLVNSSISSSNSKFEMRGFV
jgi:hypothetical protein